MNDKDKLASTNELLDELLVKQLDLIQDYITITVECESNQKSGFLSLAKARYIQGSSTVSRNCLYSEESEEERNPVVTVTRESATIDLQDGDGDESMKPLTFELAKLNINSDTEAQRQLNNQFGLLSSTTLKHAKSDFHKCLEKTMERVSISEQINTIRSRYKELLEEKLKIESRMREQ